MTSNRSVLTDSERGRWDRDGWLVLPQALDAATLATITSGVAELEEWAHTAGPGLHHFEDTDAGARLARTEKFADEHADLGSFVRGEPLRSTLRELFDDEPALFKEKVNYKHPGGGGFAPHQDATAYRFVDHHISVMVPVDPASIASGCLYFAPGHRSGQMPTDGRGRVDAAHAATLDWEPVEAEPGDVVVFDSYAPHYSETNTTNRPRRALYLTYNALTAGDHRERYYADKEAEFAAADGTFGSERVRISVSDDFLGRPVSAAPSPN